MIAILISTYNGSRYLSKQLNSLIAQTYKDCSIYIRDDGSNDGTQEIIKSYTTRYPEKIVFYDSIDNIGAGKSFMCLLELTQADYYMFCDQDDVWMPDKVEKTLAKAKSLELEYGINTPIGVFTDLTVVDSKLNILMPSLWKGDNRHPEYTRNFYKQWTNRHATYGCTLLINKAAKKIVIPYRQLASVIGGHDTWIEYILIKKGIYSYIDEPTIYYRQHSSNVIGANIGISYKNEVKDILTHPWKLFAKLLKDYKRVRVLPFRVSYTKILWYRISQSVSSLF